MSSRACLLLLGLVSACSPKKEAQASHTPGAGGAVEVMREPVPPTEPLSHLTPYLPPQCYTKTEGKEGRVHNPCFTCHQSSQAPNYIDDGAQQLSYAFPAPAQRNPWTNLFVDRREQVAATPDEDILAYVRQSNYFAEDGSLLLARALQKPAAEWDSNGNGRWDGWVPDIQYRFDGQGFDRRADGGYSGWRALAYYPFPGTFWPTNGSFGDVLVRLPEAYQQDEGGTFSPALYALNLSILESLITRRDVPVPATDERPLQVDLDGDGKLGTARKVAFVWTPPKKVMRFVGKARALPSRNLVPVAAGLFPVGTEFAHAVYYLDVVEGRPTLSRRMKELRYMAKRTWFTYGDLELAVGNENLEAIRQPDGTRKVVGSQERGVGNRAGWLLQGFIEDAKGNLRPQTKEENGYCMGCHSGVGATDDSVFSFGRKLPSGEFQDGWFHWSQRGLEGLREPRRADGQYEYAHYLAQNGAGDEFRSNTEVLARFFTPEGKLNEQAVSSLREDVSTLLLPSAERALALDKAYRLIVREQSFIRGRDATLAPVANAHRDVSGAEVLTGVPEPVDGPRAGTAFLYPGLPVPRVVKPTKVAGAR